MRITVVGAILIVVAVIAAAIIADALFQKPKRGPQQNGA